MSNNFQYAKDQVAIYLVVATQPLRQVNSDLSEITSIRSNQDKLRPKFIGMEEEKRKFEEHYDLLAEEKASKEGHVKILDGSVELFS